MLKTVLVQLPEKHCSASAGYPAAGRHSQCYTMCMTDKPASQQIDDIIRAADDWRGETLAQLRTAILQTDPHIVEEIKWKKPSKPGGVAVWSCGGTVAVADILKNAVRLTFPKGAQIEDSGKIFNTRLDSKTVRAIDFYKDAALDTAALQSIVGDAIDLNVR